MKFKYQGKIYAPSNLEKKLKKMGITMEDIEIIKDEIKEEKEEESKLKKIIVRSTKDDLRRIFYIPKDSSIPTIKELVKKQMWNPETKTGLREYTEEFLTTLYYDKENDL